MDQITGTYLLEVFHHIIDSVLDVHRAHIIGTRVDSCFHVLHVGDDRAVVFGLLVENVGHFVHGIKRISSSQSGSRTGGTGT